MLNPEQRKKIAFWLRELWRLDISTTQFGVFRFCFYSTAFLVFREVKYENFGGVDPALWHPTSFLKWLQPSPPSREWLGMVRELWLGSLLFAAKGFLTPLATFLAFSLGAYLLGITNCLGYVRHSDSIFVFASALLVFSRAGAAMSMDSLLLGPLRRWFPRYFPEISEHLPVQAVSLRLLQAFWCALFFTSGVEKLVNSPAEWLSGETLHGYLRITNYVYGEWVWLPQQNAINEWLINSPKLVALLATGVVFAELAAPIAFFQRRLRLPIVAMLAAMQIGIHLSMFIRFVQIVPVYLAWISWERLRSPMVPELIKQPEAISLRPAKILLLVACLPLIPMLFRQEAWPLLRNDMFTKKSPALSGQGQWMLFTVESDGSERPITRSAETFPFQRGLVNLALRATHARDASGADLERALGFFLLRSNYYRKKFDQSEKLALGIRLYSLEGFFQENGKWAVSAELPRAKIAEVFSVSGSQATYNGK